MTVGEKNNNPLNVKNVGASPWKGSTGTDPKGHAIFPSRVWGLRAALRTLAQYQLKHKRWTIRAILETWAPSSDTIGSIAGAKPNEPSKYARFVSDRIGIEPDSAIRLFDTDGSVTCPPVLWALVDAMARYENGKAGVAMPQDFDEAVDLYEADFAMKKEE